MQSGDELAYSGCRTARQIALHIVRGRGHFTFVGTPEQAVELIANWFTDGAADRFNIVPALPQRRGLFRTAYAGTTLRKHYGLAWPESRFEEAVREKAQR